MHYKDQSSRSLRGRRVSMTFIGGNRRGRGNDDGTKDQVIGGPDSSVQRLTCPLRGHDWERTSVGRGWKPGPQACRAYPGKAAAITIPKPDQQQQ